MTDAAQAARVAIAAGPPRHPALVRITHWITALCFFALLVSGVNIVTSHPRFYWGETGNVRTPALFELPIPASRAAVRTGYDFVLPDRNGWSRSLHFQSAWAVVFTGLLYVAFSVITPHFREKLLPANRDLSPRALAHSVSQHLHPAALNAHSYNVLQRLSYLGVTFFLFPVMVWTGLAMSPALVSVFPGAVTLLGGHQSARTIHFVASISLVLFLIVHVGMVIRSGFLARTRAMITGQEPS